MPRIGFVTTSFPRFEGDPAGSFVFGMARAFRRAGVDVEVVVPEPPDPTDWSATAPWLVGIRLLPVRYIRPQRLARLFFGAGVPDNLAQNPWNAALIPPALLRMTQVTASAVKNWDAVISHWLLPSAFVVGTSLQAVRMKRHMPHLAIAHSGDVHFLSSPALRPLALRVPFCATDLGFISENLRERYLKIIGPDAALRMMTKTHIVPMGIDLASLQSNKSKSAIRRERKIGGFAVLFLGRMVPIKGLDVLIEALTGRPGFQLIAGGDGPEREKWAHLAKTRNVHACFEGTVNEAERAELLAACDVLVLPSITLSGGRQEGLPLVLLEAMAARLPVLAADTGSVSELIRHEKTGLLFREKDAADLGRCLEQMRGDVALMDRIREDACRAVQIRDWQTITATVLHRFGLPASN